MDSVKDGDVVWYISLAIYQWQMHEDEKDRIVYGLDNVELFWDRDPIHIRAWCRLAMPTLFWTAASLPGLAGYVR